MEVRSYQKRLSRTRLKPPQSLHQNEMEIPERKFSRSIFGAKAYLSTLYGSSSYGAGTPCSSIQTQNQDKKMHNRSALEYLTLKTEMRNNANKCITICSGVSTKWHSVKVLRRYVYKPQHMTWTVFMSHSICAGITSVKFLFHIKLNDKKAN